MAEKWKKFVGLLEIWTKENPFKAIFVPTMLSGSTFFGSLWDAIKDGHIDGKEWHALYSSASGVEALLLLGILILTRPKDK